MTTKSKAQQAHPFANGDFASLMDFGRFAEQFKFPGVDSAALIETQRRNIEAVTKANQMALEGVQAIARRQVEILRQAVEEGSKAARELAKPGKPAEKLALQAELIKDAYELAMANARELTEMSARSNNAAAEVLSHRFTSSLDELKGAFKVAGAAS